MLSVNLVYTKPYVVLASGKTEYCSQKSKTFENIF